MTEYFPWAGLKRFNDTTYVANTEYFEQALYELYLASGERKFLSYKQLRDLYAPDSLQNQVDIGVINASFHSVNYVEGNVEQGGLRITADSLFEKIENGNPAFLKHQVLIAAPLKKFLKVRQGESIIYHFHPDFLLENVAKGKTSYN